jgi:hypothetical protein
LLPHPKHGHVPANNAEGYEYVFTLREYLKKKLLRRIYAPKSQAVKSYEEVCIIS